MPLHDWDRVDGWEGFHTLWITALTKHLKRVLPPDYRTFLGYGPALAVGSPAVNPDVSGRHIPESNQMTSEAAAVGIAAEGGPAPDGETVALAVPEPVPALFVERARRLVAVVEIVSPRNKDRASAREGYVRRYSSYLMDSVHLMVIDVLPRPLGFSFAEQIEAEISVPRQPPLPPPFAVSYRVGEPAAQGGRFVAFWRRRLTIGERLPVIALPLTVHESVPVDLDGTYAEAAADAYLT